MTLRNPLLRLAIDAAGGPTRAARLLGVSNATIYTWLRQGGVSKQAEAMKLGTAAKVNYLNLLRQEEAPR